MVGELFSKDGNYVLIILDDEIKLATDKDGKTIRFEFDCEADVYAHYRGFMRFKIVDISEEDSWFNIGNDS